MIKKFRKKNLHTLRNKDWFGWSIWPSNWNLIPPSRGLTGWDWRRGTATRYMNLVEVFWRGGPAGFPGLFVPSRAHRRSQEGQRLEGPPPPYTLIHSTSFFLQTFYSSHEALGFRPPGMEIQGTSLQRCAILVPWHIGATGTSDADSSRKCFRFKIRGFNIRESLKWNILVFEIYTTQKKQRIRILHEYD